MIIYGKRRFKAQKLIFLRRLFMYVVNNYNTGGGRGGVTGYRGALREGAGAGGKVIARLGLRAVPGAGGARACRRRAGRAGIDRAARAAGAVAPLRTDLLLSRRMDWGVGLPSRNLRRVAPARPAAQRPPSPTHTPPQPTRPA